MSGAAAPYWRAAGMTYIGYANQCAMLVRKCQKEPFKTQGAAREQVHYKVAVWADGVQQKPVDQAWLRRDKVYVLQATFNRGSEDPGK